MNTPGWVVKKVQPQKNYTLIITFADGTEKVYDSHPLLSKRVYAPLNNLAFFMTARAECGTVVWDDDIDIALEHLYEVAKPTA